MQDKGIALETVQAVAQCVPGQPQMDDEAASTLACAAVCCPLPAHPSCHESIKGAELQCCRMWSSAYHAAWCCAQEVFLAALAQQAGKVPREEQELSYKAVAAAAQLHACLSFLSDIVPMPMTAEQAAASMAAK